MKEILEQGFLQKVKKEIPAAFIEGTLVIIKSLTIEITIMKKYVLMLGFLTLTTLAAHSQTTASGGILTTPSGLNLNLRTNVSTINRLTILNSGNVGYVGIGDNLTPTSASVPLVLVSREGD